MINIVNYLHLCLFSCLRAVYMEICEVTMGNSYKYINKTHISANN